MLGGMPERDDDDIDWLNLPEQKRPMDRWPRAWFIATELMGAALVLWAVWYFDLKSYTDAAVNWLFGV